VHGGLAIARKRAERALCRRGSSPEEAAEALDALGLTTELVRPAACLAAVGTLPGREEEEQKGDDRVLDAAESGLFRGAAARANYLALDRLDIAFSAKELCRRMSVPRASDFVALRRLAQYLAGTPRAVQKLPWQRRCGLKLFSDTDFAGCPRTRRSTSCGVTMRGLHLIRHYSRTQKVVTLSSAEAELGGVVQGASEGLGSQAIARDLGIEADLTLLADSSAAIGICRRSGIGRVRHLAVGQLWVQERVRDKTLRLDKVAGEANPADIGTKHLGSEVMRRCMAMTNLVPREGRSAAAPAMTATVQPFLDVRPAKGPLRQPRPAVRRLLSLQGPGPQHSGAVCATSSAGLQAREPARTRRRGLRPARRRRRCSCYNPSRPGRPGR